MKTIAPKNENNFLSDGSSFSDRSDELYRIVIEQSKTLVLEYDYYEKKTYVDPLIEKNIIGDFSKISPRDIGSLKNAVYRPDMVDLQELFLEADINKSSHQTKEIRFFTVMRSFEWFRVAISVLTDINGNRQRAVVTLNNINKEVLARKRLEFLAEQDLLTGIPNKDAFIEKTRTMLEANPHNQYTIIRFDIERFHTINQLFGSVEGDRVLKFLAVKLQELFELEEEAYCRISSDIYALCVKNDEKRISEVVESIQSSFKFYPLECEFNLCFGVYAVDDPSLPVETMLDRAGHAQKTIKENYITHVAYYNDKLKRQEAEEHEIINEMEYALKSKQFEVYYQPKVRMDTGEVIGAEALVRWKHPKRGMIPPGVFIPLFEKNGFVMQVDCFVWESVCKKIREWLDKGIKVNPVSVNISRADLYNPRLVDVIVSIVDRYSIPHRLVEPELTESAFISDAMQLLNVTDELRNAGFTILMDDFGSGYSSLNSLNDIDVDILKLDMGFLSKSVMSEKGITILKSVISMANSIGLSVLAEGVETEEHRKTLIALGCIYAQGYLFSRPISVEEYEEKYVYNNLKQEVNKSELD